MTALSSHTPYPRPPNADRLGSGLLLALFVHAGLLTALASGVSWRRHTVPVVAAELWASVPRAADAAPAPPPVEPARPTPAPPPAPPAPARPAPPPAPSPAQQLRDAQIALEQRKALEREKEAERQAQALRDKQAAAKAAAEKKAAEAKAALEREKAAQEKAALEKAAQDKLAREKAALAKAAKDKADKEKADKAEKADQAAEERLAKLREANLARLRKELNANTGSTTQPQALPQPGRGAGTLPGSGTAAQSAAPSSDYAARIAARVLPRIIYNGPPVGSQRAEVEVRVAPDGRIISSKLVKSSGVAEWDREVLRGLDRTEILPRDSATGTVPPVMLLSFNPNDR
ncbi:MAG: hypothetical protein RJA44_1188 [Pseudomonadota bacterium]|jgi:colicin import membrane protein